MLLKSSFWARFKPFLYAVGLLCILQISNCGVDINESTDKPNIIILFTDDMGYGDLSSFGHPTIKTPHIDRLGKRGVRFTSFLTGSWCVPSRTQLITGRYMPRISFGGSTAPFNGDPGNGGIPDSVITLAEALKKADYNTGMVGKWHLGYRQDKFLPTGQGFDYWFGLPYSNDYMKPFVQTDVPLGLYEGSDMIEHPVNQDSLTIRYTEKVLGFINRHSKADKPFFMYMAYNMPHLPINTTEEFRGSSNAGLYGDVIETIDWSVGQITDALAKQNIEENTIVFFASDNGPWINPPERMLAKGVQLWHAGTTGHLRGSKHTSYEGGARVPAFISWPSQIPKNVIIDQMVASPDIYQTFVDIAGVTLPRQVLDGYNILPFLKGEQADSPRREYAYFLDGKLEALRQDEWKLRIYEGKKQLFNLQDDPGERFNRAKNNPDIVKKLQRKMVQLAHDMDSTKIDL